MKRTDISRLNRPELKKEKPLNKHVPETNISAQDFARSKHELLKDVKKLEIEQTNISLLNVADIQKELSKAKKLNIELPTHELLGNVKRLNVEQTNISLLDVADIQKELKKKNK